MIIKVSETSNIEDAISFNTNSCRRALLNYRNQFVGQDVFCAKYYIWTPNGTMKVLDRRGNDWEPDYQLIQSA